ncbi:MAG: DUF4340 domain-containing protein [Puniceicoccaceae bacterium]
MRYKLTVLLIVLNLALFSLIFYIDRVQSTRSVFESTSRLILDRSFVQGIDKVRITSTASGTEWQLQQAGDNRWDVISPIHWKANPYAIQQLLFQLKGLSWESRFPVDDLASAGQSLESYNLAAPPLEIELSSGTNSVRLAIGAPTEIGNRLYMMAPDGKFILVISRGIMELLQREMDVFLDRRIFGLGMEESRVIQVQDRSASNVRVRLERDETGWNFVSPIEAAADPERVQAMIAEWQTIEAEGFEMMENPGLEMNSNAVQLTFEGLNERETLVLAPPAGVTGTPVYFLAKRDAYDAIFKVDAAEVDALRTAQEVLREKRMLNRHADDWTSLSIAFGDLTTTLQQLENGSWQVLNTDTSGALNAKTADPETIGKVKALLRNMEAVRFVSDAPSENDLVRYGLDDPQRTITLRKASGQSVVFNVGGISREDEGTLLYANTSQSASVFVVRPHLLADLPLDASYYWDRTLFTLPETADILDVQLVSRDSSEPVPLQEAAVATLTGYMRNVRVARFLDEPFSDPLQLGDSRTIDWTYALEATVDFGASPTLEVETLQFLVSSRLGGSTQYLARAETGEIGTLPAEVIEALDSALATFPDDPGGAPDEPVFIEEPVEPEETVPEPEVQP